MGSSQRYSLGYLPKERRRGEGIKGKDGREVRGLTSKGIRVSGGVEGESRIERRGEPEGTGHFKVEATLGRFKEEHLMRGVFLNNQMSV